jgi:aminoglycoside phosphotransferase (APT) family kinase protein
VASPPAEIAVDADLVRSLLVDQHPDLASCDLEELDAGWDNTMWRLGRDLLVRLPRRAVAAPLARNEQRWLPDLARRLPLPVPVPVRQGRPSDRFPWCWSVVPWLDGVPGDRAPVPDGDGAAWRLGNFLRALHRVAPAEAPANPYRGVPLAERTATFEDRLQQLAGVLDISAPRRVFELGLAAEPWTGSGRWLHGDLHPANVLTARGTLVAVIDFGDVCGGDPATDVAAAWMLLPVSSFPAFAEAYGGIDVHLEKRSLAWAVLFGVFLLGIGLTDRPSFAPVARTTLARSIARASR